MGVSSDGKIQIGEITTTLTWLMTPIGLLIDEATISGGPVTLDLDELGDSTGDLNFDAKILNKSLEVFLEKLQPAGLHNFKVEIKPDGIHMDATKTVLVPIPTTAHAILKLVNEDEVRVELLSAEALGAGLTNMVSNQVEQINPVVKADMFPFPVQFKEIVHEEGFVRIVGEAQLSETNEG